MRTVDRIEQLIEDRGLNKARFCELMGVGTSYFSNWKRRGFPAKRLPEAARILGVSVEELTSGDSKPTYRVEEAFGGVRQKNPKVANLALSLDHLLAERRLTEKDIDLLWSITKRIAATSEEKEQMDCEGGQS